MHLFHLSFIKKDCLDLYEFPWLAFRSSFYFELRKIIKNMASKVKHGLAVSECNLIKNFKLPWKIWILVHFKCKNLTWSIHTSRGNFSTIAKLGIKMSRIFVPCFLKIQNFRVTASRTAKRICGEAYQYRKKPHKFNIQIKF